MLNRAMELLKTSWARGRAVDCQDGEPGRRLAIAVSDTGLWICGYRSFRQRESAHSVWVTGEEQRELIVSLICLLTAQKLHKSLHGSTSSLGGGRRRCQTRIFSPGYESSCPVTRTQHMTDGQQWYRCCSSLERALFCGPPSFS